MNSMSREEEIILLKEMIKETEKKLEERNSDRLYLETELNQLKVEYLELLWPKNVFKKIICVRK